jgi:3-phenylpropionate/trans-cinnamate dioxygenase ferredoxin reductase subunit
MTSYPYLIIGGGMTADAAVRGIRELDKERQIGLISAEGDAPYNRPPLTKGLWKGKPNIDKIWRQTGSRGVDLLLGRTVQTLDLERRIAIDKGGQEYGYEKLLLATGGSPRRLPFGGDDVIYYRTVADYRRLREVAQPGRRVAVIGAGFIGSELAASMRSNGVDVVMIYPEEHIGQRVYPAGLAGFVSDYYRDRGVELLPGHIVSGLQRQGSRYALLARPAKDGEERTVEADAVVAGLGITPNVELAKQAGLPVDNGIVVDEHLRAGRPEVFAAGDVASFANPALGRRLRVEHEDNANTMGTAAGRAMAGATEPYNHLPYFYSDLFDLGYEAVGETDSRLEMVEDWQEPFRKGVVYYLRDGRVRGVLLWNVWEQVPAARRLIAEPGPFRAEDLAGRLPEDGRR